jgi:hypothetical protein
MTNAEMNRRLATMTPELIETVKRMVEQGYGETGIVNNSMATRKQANAVFKLVQG